MKLWDAIQLHARKNHWEAIIFNVNDIDTVRGILRQLDDSPISWGVTNLPKMLSQTPKFVYDAMQREINEFGSIGIEVQVRRHDICWWSIDEAPSKRIVDYHTFACTYNISEFNISEDSWRRLMEG